MDGVFKCMLLLKKKKYASVKVEVTADGSTVEVSRPTGSSRVTPAGVAAFVCEGMWHGWVGGKLADEPSCRSLPSIAATAADISSVQNA